MMGNNNKEPLYTDDFQELAIKLLELLNQSSEKIDTIHEILSIIKDYTGFDAVGIRLKDGEDYPYYEANGFTEDFVQAEKFLCACNDLGEIVRDEEGNSVLECMCGNVIRRRTDPSLDFFTAGGSFWANSTTEFFALTTEEDWQSLLRGRCNKEGYESLALIPLHNGDEMIGLLQLNDRRRDMFTLEMVDFFERIGGSIGIALKHRVVDEELAQTNIFLETILNNTHMLVAYMDAGFNFIKVNRVYAEKDERNPSFFIGKNHFDLYPNAENEGIFQRVVETGEPYIVYAKPFVYPQNPERGVSYWDWSLMPIKDTSGRVESLVLTMADVTIRRQMENELTQFREQLEDMVKERTIELKNANDKFQKVVVERIKTEEEKTKAYKELDQIFSTISVGISYIDREFNFIRVNNRFLEIFFLKEDEVNGKKCYDVLPNSRCNTKFCILNRLVSSDGIDEYEATRENENGKVIKYLVSSVPYLSGDGKVIGIAQYYIDVTEKREIQMEVLNISESERQRIGNDLHDVIGQNLTAIAFLLEALKTKVIDEQYSDALKNIEQIGGLIGNAIAQTRKITRMLCPVEMEKRGLFAALNEMARNTEEIYNISCKVIKNGDIIVDDIQIATHLFYIAREAVYNSIKHGNPENISIHLNCDDSSLNMIIIDDGIGITEAEKDQGMGLRIMKYRANMIGADFYAVNGDDRGFVVDVRLRK